MNVAVCHICETAENLSSVEIGGETVFLCPDCREEHLKQCYDCGEYFTDDADYVVDAGGDVYCRSCADDHLSYCEKCGEYSNADNFVHVENLDEWWCESCAERHAYHCDNCGEYVSENRGDADTYLCSRCYEEDYSTCEYCGELVHNTASVSTDNGTFCRYCYDENHSEYIHNYVYDPFLIFQSSKDDDEKCLAYLGFELEAGGLEESYECKRLAEDIFEEEETFYLKEDGSIPDYGFELVSQPITLKRHKELDWQNILSQMSETGMKSHDLGEEACGLHVHVSRNYLTPTNGC